MKENFMINILFVCHGNICRSPMAQFVMQYLVDKEGLSGYFYIDSAATSREEIGNDVHYGTKQKLKEMGIPYEFHASRQLRMDDLNRYDFIIGMDQANIFNMQRILKSNDKCYTLLSFARSDRDIADPWYTGNFDVTYRDVNEGCTALLRYLKDNGYVKEVRR